MARTDLEQLVFTMSADIRGMQKQLAKASGDVDRTTRRIQGRFDQQSGHIGRALDRTFSSARLGVIQAGAARVGIFGSALEELGPAGIAAAAGVAAIAVAFNQAKQAMDFADEIADSAAQAQIGVETLQEYRLAMLAAGGAEKDADEAIKSFDSSLGKLINHSRGFKKVRDALRELGLTDEQIQNIHTFEDFMAVAPDKFAALGNAAKKAQIADALGIRGLLPLLNQGSAGVQGLIDKMHDLGVILDAETVRELGEAHDKAELFAKVIDLQLKLAFVRLAPLIVAGLEVTAEWARGLRGFADDVVLASEAVGDLAQLLNLIGVMHVAPQFDDTSLGKFERRVAGLLRLLSALDPKLRRGAAALDRDADRRQLRAGVKAIADGPVQLTDAQRREIFGDARPAAEPPLDLSDHSGSSGRRSRSGKDPAKEAEERQRRFDDAWANMERDILSASADLTLSLQERFDISRLQSESARAEYEEDLRRKVADKDYTQAQADALLAQRDIVDQLQVRAAEQKLAADKAAEARQVQDNAFDIQMQLLQLASSNARTSEERRTIELQLLDTAYQRLKAEQEAVIASIDSTAAEKEIARAKLAAADLARPGQTQNILNQTATPWEQFAKDAQITTERLQQLSVDGLGSLNEALIDSIGSAEDAGEAIRNVFFNLAKQMLLMAAQQAEAKLLTAFIPGFASGTPFAPGGPALVGEQGPEIVNLNRGDTVTPTSATIKALGGGGRGGTHIEVTQVVSLQANGDKNIIALVRTASRAAVGEAVKIAARQQPGVSSKFRQLEA